MGAICSSCFGGDGEVVGSYSNVRRASAEAVKNVKTPDPDERRRQLAEAAEKRLQQQEGRGIHNIESVKRQQQRKEEMEKKEEEMARMGRSGEPVLTWQMS